ncbi:P-type conjugative transfer protein TrbL [Massilia soli]|uniref:P-type conjugative transfer protein TrbL n=1 Tax=Massilia soli TaxID=2792854 RepID=A0ABS7SMP3_9BURK|nr:P-type conjugative transfer protein TrbL [Massilia soli]MBZ2206568.1 P-type conjugative transfer protein TrbL [Massilia soli]
MEKPVILKHPSILVLIWLALFSVQAAAAIDNVGVLDTVLERYTTAAATWGAIIITRATWLFWTLAVISMVWTFGMMALRKADIGEFYAEFIRFTIFTGFFWWLLTNGSAFAESIMRSLRMVGAEAAGIPNTMAPSGIVDIGFDIFVKALNQTDMWKPIDSLIGMIMALIILVVFALIGVNMLLLLVSGWILAYAGVFFLGFGGSRWTSDMAITYFKTVLGIAGQLFAMILLIGIGKSFVDQYYAGLSNGLLIKELAVMLLVSIILLALVRTVPGVVGSLAGGSTGALGQGFGAGAVVGAAAMAGAAIATAGAAIAAGAAGAAGGAQALMAAYSKASAAEGASGGAGSLLAAAGGGGGSGGDDAANDAAVGSPLAAAMGDGGGSSTGSSSGLTGSGSSGSSGGATEGAEQAGGAGEGAGQKEAAAEGGDKGAAAADKGEAAGDAKQGGLGIKAARAGKIAAGTAANLAVGAWDVAKAKGADLRQSAADRIGESTGGKIANAINTRAAADKVAKFGTDSLSAAVDDKGLDAESEVAAFRDRGNKAS